MQLCTCYCRLNRLLDRNNMALFMYNVSIRWSTYRFDVLGLAAATASALIVTFLPSDEVDAGSAGLALSFGVNVSVMPNYNCLMFAVTPTCDACLPFVLTPLYRAFHLLWHLHVVIVICYDTFIQCLPFVITPKWSVSYSPRHLHAVPLIC